MTLPRILDPNFSNLVMVGTEEEILEMSEQLVEELLTLSEEDQLLFFYMNRSAIAYFMAKKIGGVN